MTEAAASTTARATGWLEPRLRATQYRMAEAQRLTPRLESSVRSLSRRLASEAAALHANGLSDPKSKSKNISLGVTGPTEEPEEDDSELDEELDLRSST